MKASWNGYFRLGDLTVPMRLFSATRSSAPSFVHLHAADKTPITRVATCPKDGKILKSDEIIRAVKHEDSYIEVSDADVQASGVAERNVVVRQFSNPDTISPMYYEKPYYMVPGKGGEAAYTLLRQAFDQTKKIAITTFMLYGKEHIGIVAPFGGVLLLQQLRFADEIVPLTDLPTPPLPQPAPSQVDTAAKLMERYTMPFYPTDYRNEQLDHLRDILTRKAKGLPPKKAPQAAQHATPADKVMPALQHLIRQDPAALHNVT